MPTYKNPNKTPVIVRDAMFPFCEEVAVNFTVDEEKTGLILVSENPKYSPISFSSVVPSGGVIDISKFIMNDNEVMLLRIVSTKDVSFIYFNGNAEKKAAVTINSPVDLRNPDFYKTVHVSSGEVSVELWKGFSWR